MTGNLKNIFLPLLAAMFTLLFLNGCSTVAGAGKDLQKAGQVIEREAEKI